MLEECITFEAMNSKPVNIIPIARKKLVQRGVAESMVFETIHEPDQLVEGAKGRVVAQRKYFFDDSIFLLRVVYEEKDNQLTVITGYFTSQVSRYWEEQQYED